MLSPSLAGHSLVVSPSLRAYYPSLADQSFSQDRLVQLNAGESAYGFRGGLGACDSQHMCVGGDLQHGCVCVTCSMGSVTRHFDEGRLFELQQEVERVGKWVQEGPGRSDRRALGGLDDDRALGGLDDDASGQRQAAMRWRDWAELWGTAWSYVATPQDMLRSLH